MSAGFQTPRARNNWPTARRTAASCLLELGRYEEALDCATLARQFFREVGDHKQELQTGSIMGRLLLHLDRRSEGVALLLACLHEAVEQGFRSVPNLVLGWGLTVLAAEVQDWTTLVQFAAFAHDPSSEVEQRASDHQLRRELAEACEAMGEAGYLEAWVAGTRLMLPDAVELAERLVRNLAAEHPTTKHLSTENPSMRPQRPGVGSEAPSVLTPREWEVLALVAQGHPDRRIARLLNISPGTASKHVGNLLGKLELRNRVELARWAIEHRTVTPP